MKEIKISIVRGVEGLAVYIGDIRVCGNKPWGGGQLVKVWTVSLKDIFYAIGSLTKPSFQPKDLKADCVSWCPWKNTSDKRN